MKLLLALTCACALTGCATREYGSWLDQVGRLPNPRVRMADEEASQLTAEAVRLRGQADAIRMRLAAEPDRIERFRAYGQLREINDQLAPLERRLTDAGRYSRARTPG